MLKGPVSEQPKPALVEQPTKRYRTPKTNEEAIALFIEVSDDIEREIGHLLTEDDFVEDASSATEAKSTKQSKRSPRVKTGRSKRASAGQPKVSAATEVS